MPCPLPVRCRSSDADIPSRPALHGPVCRPVNLDRRLRWACGLLAPLALLPPAGCLSASDPPPVVSNVELGRYTGAWYEIARYPVSFQEGCYATTAEYSLRPDGRINVINTCREGAFDGRLRTIKGTARVARAGETAKLKVSFFGPFEGDYWIVALDPEYQWAVVSEPGRRMLWILSRTSTLSDAVYADILQRITDLGFDPARLLLTPQPA